MAVKTVSAARLWRTGSDAVLVGNLLMNEEGIVLLTLRHGHPGVKSERDVVYWLAHDKILWSQDRDKHALQTFMPFAVGASHVYAASWDPVEGCYLLVAEDFRTETRRYALGGLPSNWPFAYDLFHDYRDFGIDFAKVARISDDEELVLWLRQTATSSFREIEIFRGSDGVLMGRVPCTGTGLNCALSHPSIGHIAFTTEATRLPEKVYNSLEAFGRYRVFITLRFSYGGEVVLRLVSIDVVLVFKDWLIRPNYHPDSLVVMDSFNRTACISSAQKPEEEYSNSSWTLWSCPLVPADDSALYNAAMAAIPHVLRDTRYTEEPKVARQCYILAKWNKVTLPANLRKGRDKSKALKLPDPSGNWYGRVAGGLVSLFLEEECYVLNFV